jgi:hypothetical protein
MNSNYMGIPLYNIYLIKLAILCQQLGEMFNFVLFIFKSFCFIERLAKRVNKIQSLTVAINQQIRSLSKGQTINTILSTNCIGIELTNSFIIPNQNHLRLVYPFVLIQFYLISQFHLSKLGSLKFIQKSDKII